MEPLMLSTIKFALGALTPESADHAMQSLADEMKRVAARGLQCMMLLGQVLLEVQDRELWRGKWPNWGACLRDAAQRFSSVSVRTAYDAMDLARSPALNHMPADQVNAIASVGNAKRLVRLERSGEPITTEIIEMSQNLPTQEFHRQTGATAGTKVQVWVQDPAAGAAMQRLVDVLIGASAGALDGLVELLKSDRMIGYAGTGRDSRLDAILGAIVTAVNEDLDSAQPTPQEIPEAPESGAGIGSIHLAAFEYITGLELQIFAGHQQPYVVYGYVNDDLSTGHPAAYGSGQSIEAALEDLRETRLKAVILAKIQEQHFLCAGCAKALALQGHHVIFRSHGGTDRPENIEAVCAGCHYKRHHRKFPAKAKQFEEEPVIDCLHGALVVQNSHELPLAQG